jgi:hypothetical protein
MRGTLEMEVTRNADSAFDFTLGQGKTSMAMLTARSQPGRYIYLESEGCDFVLGCVKLLHEETCHIVLSLGELSLTSAHPAAFYLLNSQPLIEAAREWCLLE